MRASATKCFAAFGVLWLGAVIVRATVLVPAEFREIVNGSEIIAYGRVVDAEPEMSDDRKRVETIVTFEVGTYLKGGPGETITFRVPGGRIGRYRTVLVGAPSFEPGEEAVLFFDVRPGVPPFIFGLSQGVFRVRRDGSTQQRLVIPSAPMARGAAPETVVRGSRRPVALETFGAQVRAVMAEAASKEPR
jgi:hypothetical protein